MLSSFRHRLFFCICILHIIQCITYEKYRKVKKSLQKSNPIRTGGQNGKTQNNRPVKSVCQISRQFRVLHNYLNYFFNYLSRMY